MIHPNASDTVTVRSVFVIGPDNKVKLTLTYPASTGRNFHEMLRVIDSLQLTAKHKVATPADWKQGEDVIIVPAVSDEDAKKKFPKGFDGEEAVPARRRRSRTSNRIEPGSRARSGEQADELAEHHGGGAPDLVAEQIEVGILDRDAFADPGALPDSRGVAQIVERHLENLFHFTRRRHGSRAGDRSRRRSGAA